MSNLRSTFTRTQSRFIMIVMLFVMAVATQAQVTLSIPTDDIFTSINSWIVTFVPVVAIGIGISAALAILMFVGNVIVKAFKGRM
jgi:hypothetical protein